MELKDFIKYTLTSINEAISESQQELKSKGVLINPDRYSVTESGKKELGNFKAQNTKQIHTVEFDIFLGIDKEKGRGGGGKIKVAELLQVGLDRSSTKTNLNHHRVKFEIPVIFSTVKTPEELLGSEFSIK